jgi:Uma2 family endonuclease
VAIARPRSQERLRALLPAVLPVAGPGIELPNTPEISPDVAGWRRERMPEMPDDEPVRMVSDWVCEILSKPTRRHDQLVKLPYYAEVGAAYAWGSWISKRVC